MRRSLTIFLCRTFAKLRDDRLVSVVEKAITVLNPCKPGELLRRILSER